MTKILLVEDDQTIVTNLTAFLQGEGYTVRSVTGQAAAMKHLCAERADLVLMDVSLVEGNGFAACKAIKAEYGIPVIFLTASVARVLSMPFPLVLWSPSEQCLHLPVQA